jgi:SAM-dependent methyltransferase
MDFSDSARDYAKHRVTFPDAFFERVPLSGRVLDLGSGTGSLARGYAQRGAWTVALDISRAMLAEATGVPARVAAKAEACPFRSESFDAVTAGQCWHWFDGPATAREVKRLLKPGGRIVIGHFNYLPLKGSAAEASEALILDRYPDWGFSGVTHMGGVWDDTLREAGFRELTSRAWELELPYTHEAWRGRMRACNGVLKMSPPLRADFDAAHERMLKEKFPEPLTVRHEVFALVAVK